MGEDCSEIGGLRLRNPPLKHIIDTSKKKRDFDTAAEAAGVVGGDEEEEEPVSPASRMFHEPDFSVYVLAILGCKTLIDPEVLKANLGHNIFKHPHFRSIQVEDDTGGMKWVRTAVDMENHVIALHDVGGCGLESRKKFVEDYMFNLSKTKIDTSRPMWDLHILNFHDGDAAATNHEEEKGVAIFRAHHSLGDGTSLMSLLLACTRQTANPAAVPTVPNIRKKKTAEAADARWLTRCLVAVWSVLRMMWYTVADVAMFFATSWFLKDTVTPLKGPPGLEFTPRRFVHRTVSLDDIKLIKNAMNATINDVALGMAQAGLSRYLNRKYGERDEKATPEKNNLPKKMRLRSTLLINLRPAGIQALADMMMKDSKAQWGNWIGFVLLPFTIALRHDPLDYVRQAKATVDRKKQSLEGKTDVVRQLHLEIGRHWRHAKHIENAGNEEDEDNEEHNNDHGCDVDYISEEDDCGSSSIDRESFLKLLFQVPCSDAKIFSKLDFLSNMAYFIPKISVCIACCKVKVPRSRTFMQYFCVVADKGFTKLLWFVTHYIFSGEESRSSWDKSESYCILGSFSQPIKQCWRLG